MNNATPVIRAGTRASKLALVQSRSVLDQLKSLFSRVTFEEVQITTPGDRDKSIDLRTSPADFFTRDLDDAVLKNRIDCAIHSAKDLPNPMPAGLDWFWLPWREDPRDAIVLTAGNDPADIPAHPRIGVSSDRREAWCKKRFPGAEIKSIRGTIEERIALLDKGDYDIVIIAGAALLRLGLEKRISEWIPAGELQTPDGQGVLAMTFRKDDARFQRLRSLFVKSVCFVSAGAGSADTCTIGGIKALQRCEVCLYDSLMDPHLLEHLPATALRIDTGKRCGSHSMPQAGICALITMYARRGLRVVRLKGGDAGIFGRLAEEVEALDALHLPYRVIPGVSSLNAATTGTGMLLTRRGISRGFCVMTPRQQNGGIASVQKDERAKLPIAFFMGVSVTEEIAAALISEGTAADTPAAMVFGAGSESETIVRGTLKDIAAKVRGPGASCIAAPEDMPGLLLVREVTRYGFNHTWGALQGKRILLTCSQDLQEKAADAVTTLGGIPIKRPLIKLVPELAAIEKLKSIDRYDWLVITSPAAVRCLFEVLDSIGTGNRTFPKVIVCGPGTEAELAGYRVYAEAAPASEFGADGLNKIAGTLITPGQKILRIRSDNAGPAIANHLTTLGAEVTDCVLYRNQPVAYDSLPEFDAVFFASASAVEAYVSRWSAETLRGKTIAAIGQPTRQSLSRNGLNTNVVGKEATVASTIEALAARYVKETLETQP